MAVTVQNPIEYYNNPTIGRPVFAGFLYVGQPDTDPEIPANRLPVTAIQEDGTQVPISQPIRTNAGGNPELNGSPVQLTTTGPYSLRIKDRNDVELFYVPSTDGTQILAGNNINKFQPVVSPGQTSINVPDAPPGVNVYINGVLLQESDGDYSYNPASGNIGLTNPIVAGDVVEVQYGEVVASGVSPLDGQIWYRPTDAPYNAVGDGVTDDTDAVNACLAAEPYVIIDKVYAVSETINAANYLTCINGGEFKYIGPETNPTEIVLNLDCPQFGKIRVDANQKEVKCVVANNTAFQTGEYIECRGVRASDSNKNLSSGLLVDGGNEFHVSDVYIHDCLNAGHLNDSFPQAVVSSGAASKVVIGSATIEDCQSGLVTSSTGELFFGTYTAKNMEDNGLYVLGTSTVRGGNYTYEGNEEPVSNQGYCYVDSVLVRGRTFSAIRIEDAEETWIGHLHGTYPEGTLAADIVDNIPRGILAHRSGNVASGNHRVNRVTGDFNELLFRTGLTATSESLTVGSADVNLRFKNSDPNWSPNDWFNLSGIKQIDIADFKVRIIDEENALTGASILEDVIDTGTLDKPSTIENLDVTIHNSDLSYSAAVYRGQDQPDSGLMRMRGAVWQTNLATAYRRNANLGERESTINDQAPQSGYWFQGQKLESIAYDGDNIRIMDFRATSDGIGAAADWVQFAPARLVNAGGGGPNGSVVGNYEGEILINTNGSFPFTTWICQEAGVNFAWVQIG